MLSFESPISKVETHHILETTSGSDEDIKRNKSLTPMSIETDVISDAFNKKNHIRRLELEVKSKSKELQRLEKDTKKSSVNIKNMRMEQKNLVEKLRKLRKLSKKWKSNGKFQIAQLKRELKSQQEKHKVKEKEIT